jgi:hypothetical protein
MKRNDRFPWTTGKNQNYAKPQRVVAFEHELSKSFKLLFKPQELDEQIFAMEPFDWQCCMATRGAPWCGSCECVRTRRLTIFNFWPSYYVRAPLYATGRLGPGNFGRTQDMLAPTRPFRQ